MSAVDLLIPSFNRLRPLWFLKPTQFRYAPLVGLALY